MILIVVLAIIVCILLILIVTIQNPKGGGIASNFSAGNQIMGVKRTNDFVEKATWVLAAALLVLSLTSNLFTQSDVVGRSGDSLLQDKIEQGELSYPDANAPLPSQAPVEEAAPPVEGE
jgi:preprotein translocase subunit SecG